MSSFLERLRQQKEEEARQAQARREERDRKTAEEYEKLRAETVIHKDNAEDIFEKTEYPRLLKELAELTEVKFLSNTTHTDSMGTFAYEHDGYSHERGHFYLPSGIIPYENSIVRLGYWYDKREKPKDWRDRLLRSPKYRPQDGISFLLGFLIEVTPNGEILAYGKERYITPRYQWEGNAAIQENILERVYTSPFDVKHVHISTGPQSSGQYA